MALECHLRARKQASERKQHLTLIIMLSSISCVCRQTQRELVDAATVIASRALKVERPLFKLMACKQREQSLAPTSSRQYGPSLLVRASNRQAYICAAHRSPPLIIVTLIRPTHTQQWVEMSRTETCSLYQGCSSKPTDRPTVCVCVCHPRQLN